jgi:hypothetical protein
VKIDQDVLKQKNLDPSFSDFKWYSLSKIEITENNSIYFDGKALNPEADEVYIEMFRWLKNCPAKI